MRCVHTSELEAAVRAGHWPAAVSAELRDHVAGCRGCREYAAVSAAMLRMRAAALGEACVPTAGSIWWRAQLRKRRETMEALERPLRRAQMLGVAMCLVCAVLAAGWLLHVGVDWTGARAVFTLPVLLGTGVLLAAMGAVMLRGIWERD